MRSETAGQLEQGDYTLQRNSQFCVSYWISREVKRLNRLGPE